MQNQQQFLQNMNRQTAKQPSSILKTTLLQSFSCILFWMHITPLNNHVDAKDFDLTKNVSLDATPSKCVLPPLCINWVWSWPWPDLWCL